MHLVRVFYAMCVIHRRLWPGDLCEGGALYPIHRNGVGVCVDKCPRDENGDRVSGHATEDKAKMFCMDAKDFADYTDAGTHG